MVHLGNRRQLFRPQSAGTARRAPFAQRLHALSHHGALPPGSGSAAYPEFSGYIGLFQSSLQVLCGQQAPALHFVASQNALCGCVHIPRAVFLVTRAIPEYQKTFHMQIVFGRILRTLVDSDGSDRKMWHRAMPPATAANSIGAMRSRRPNFADAVTLRPA